MKRKERDPNDIEDLGLSRSTLRDLEVAEGIRSDLDRIQRCHPHALLGQALNAAFPTYSFRANGDARESAGVCKRRVGVKEID